MTKLGREFFEDLRDELAAVDPSMSELDVDDPNVRFSLYLLVAILSGEDFTVGVGGEDGASGDAFNVVNYGEDEDGVPMLDIKPFNTDGTMSPDAANMAAAVLTVSTMAEIDSLTETQE